MTPLKFSPRGCRKRTGLPFLGSALRRHYDALLAGQAIDLAANSRCSRDGVVEALRQRYSLRLRNIRPYKYQLVQR